jgi:predicted  nucleic acid-binding Zn-ribbon protein
MSESEDIRVWLREQFAGLEVRFQSLEREQRRLRRDIVDRLDRLQAHQPFQELVGKAVAANSDALRALNVELADRVDNHEQRLRDLEEGHEQ